MNNHASKRILIIDEDEFTRSKLINFFNDNHYSVTEANSLQNGIDEISKQAPDLILIDSHISNHRTIETIKQLSPTAIKIPMIAMINNPTLSQMIEAYSHGAWDCIDKQTMDLLHLQFAIYKIFDRITAQNENNQTIDQLKQTNNQYQSIFKSLPDIIYRLDNMGNITFISNTIRLYGYEPEQLVGENIFKIIHQDDHQKAWFRINERRTRDRRTSNLEIRFLTKDAESVPMEINDQLVKSNDSVFLVAAEGLYASDIPRSETFIGTQGIARDITERKKIERERQELLTRLRQAQKIEAIGTLASGIAHDFNNILAPILGYTQMLLEEASTTQSTNRYLHIIYKAAIRAKELVKQILAFCREAEESFEPVKIQLIVRESIKLLRASLPATIQIQQYISVECGPIMANAAQIHQVVMNLCTNAYQAMDNNTGIVKVIVNDIVLEAPETRTNIKTDLPAGRYVKLVVSDTGHGIEKHHLDYIFEPYFTTKGKGKGTGLGLSVVHGIVKKCAGDILIESELEKGTTVTVYFPCIQDDLLIDEVPQLLTLPSGKGETIVFVDDEKEIVHMAKSMLEKEKYNVISFTSSVEALHFFRNNPNKIDLFITDMTMPLMTGVELTQKLLAIRPDLPIIICTGFSMQIDEEKALQIGIKEYIMKPFLKKDVLTAIRHVLDNAQKK